MSWDNEDVERGDEGTVGRPCEQCGAQPPRQPVECNYCGRVLCGITCYAHHLDRCEM